MFFIGDSCYYKEKGKRKEKVKVIGAIYDLTNYRFILETKDEKIIEVGEPISVAIMIGDMEKDDYYAGLKDGFIVYNAMNQYNN